MAHTYTNLLFHVVFGTRASSPPMDAEFQERLQSYVGGIVRELDGKLLTAGGAEDHVHLLLSLGAALSVAEAVRVIKTNSSRWVHVTWPERRRFAWQMGYGAFTVSESGKAPVTSYIHRQRERHRRMSFREEYLALLRKHGLSVDPRFVFD